MLNPISRAAKLVFKDFQQFWQPGTFFSMRVKNTALDSASDGAESGNGKLQEKEEECGGGGNSQQQMSLVWRWLGLNWDTSGRPQHPECSAAN